MKITIMQGIPGSGKSYHALRLWREQGGALVSADNYPGLYTGIDGQVRINQALLGPAYGSIFLEAIEALRAGLSVVVDNTNLTAMEVNPWILLAQAFKAKPTIVRVLCDVDKAMARNTHGVPPAAYERMTKALATFEPAWHWQYVPGYSVETIEN